MPKALPPKVYLQPHHCAQPPTLCVGNEKYEVELNTALLWMQYLTDYVAENIRRRAAEIKP